MLMLTKHSLDLRLARDLELGIEASEPHRPNMEGVLSFPTGTEQRERNEPLIMHTSNCPQETP